ncbi:MAG: hypothetical protein V3V31_16140 [Methylococcales bacterium]
MSKSTAQRQAAYRDKIAGTHKRVEIILDEPAYRKLKTLVEQSDYCTRIDYITALIEKEHTLLSGNNPKNGHKKEPLPDNGKKAVSHKRPIKKKTEKIIKIWQDEKRCQGQTARGTRCRIEHHLSVIRYKAGKKTYEVVACKQHFDHFRLHESLLT